MVLHNQHGTILCMLHIVSFADHCLAYCKCNILYFDECVLKYQMLSLNASLCLFGCTSQLMGLYQSKIHKHRQQQIVHSRLSPADTEHLHTRLSYPYWNSIRVPLRSQTNLDLDHLIVFHCIVFHVRVNVLSRKSTHKQALYWSPGIRGSVKSTTCNSEVSNF